SLGVLARLWPMRDTTADKDRGAACAMPGAARPLLAIPLGFGHAHFAACFGAVRSQTGICHLAHIRLMHQARVDFDFKNIRRQVNLLDFLAGLVIDWNLHGEYSLIALLA